MLNELQRKQICMLNLMLSFTIILRKLLILLILLTTIPKAVEKRVANLKDSTATIDRKILNDQNPVNQPTSRKLSRKIVIEDSLWFYFSLPSFKLDHGILVFALKCT